MELETQKYLRSGHSLSDLVENFSIKPRENNELRIVSLNYDQINSPMHERICQECRALILELDTWNVVSRSFFKFWNHSEELAAPIDWNTARVLEKLDGSLACLYWHKDEWRWATKGTPDASGNVGDKGYTFHTLIEKTMEKQCLSYDIFDYYLQRDRYYSFELTTPENIVIIPHDKYQLTLIGVWDANTLEEVYGDIEFWNCIVGFGGPKSYPLKSYDDVVAATQAFEKFECEGFVVVDAFFNRIKIKAPAYLMADRVMSRLATDRRKVELLISGTYDDVRGVLPWHIRTDLDAIFEKILAFRTEVLMTYDSMKNATDRKGFALRALPYSYKSILFALHDGKDIDEIIKNHNTESLAKMLNLSSV